jgi:hypothetical protein
MVMAIRRVKEGRTEIIPFYCGQNDMETLFYMAERLKAEILK